MCIVYIKAIMDRNDINSKAALKRIFEDCLHAKDRIKIGLSFMKAVFLKHSEIGSTVNENIRKFYVEELEELAELRLGMEFSSLLSYLISNFPVGNILRMQQKDD